VWGWNTPSHWTTGELWVGDAIRDVLALLIPVVLLVNVRCRDVGHLILATDAHELVTNLDRELVFHIKEADLER